MFALCTVNHINHKKSAYIANKNLRNTGHTRMSLWQAHTNFHHTRQATVHSFPPIIICIFFSIFNLSSVRFAGVLCNEYFTVALSPNDFQITNLSILTILLVSGLESNASRKWDRDAREEWNKPRGSGVGEWVEPGGERALECWGSWGLSPSPVMLMHVDTLYYPAHPVLLAKRASGLKHYFHFMKDRITTIKKRGTRKESCLTQVSSPHMSMQGFRGLKCRLLPSS